MTKISPPTNRIVLSVIQIGTNVLLLVSLIAASYSQIWLLEYSPNLNPDLVTVFHDDLGLEKQRIQTIRPVGVVSTVVFLLVLYVISYIEFERGDVDDWTLQKRLTSSTFGFVGAAFVFGIGGSILTHAISMGLAVLCVLLTAKNFYYMISKIASETEFPQAN